MEWRGILVSLFFILSLAESSGRSGLLWSINLGGGQTFIYSWSIWSASLFVLVALFLSMYLIFEHLSAYNQPEVRYFSPNHHLNWLLASVCMESFPFYFLLSFQILSIHRCSEDWSHWKKTSHVELTALLFDIISGAKVLNWTRFDGSCLCARISMDLIQAIIVWPPPFIEPHLYSITASFYLCWQLSF